MTNHFRPRNIAYFAAGGVAAALFVSGVAHAITDSIFQYSTPQTGVLTIPAAAFGPTSSTYAYNKDDRSIAPTAINTEICFIAPVNLTDGVKIKTISVWYTRASDAFTFNLYLNRLNLRTGATGDALFNKSLLPNNDQYGGASYNLNVNVNNAFYAYTLTACMQQDIVGEVELHAVRLAYTYTNAGD